MLPKLWFLKCDDFERARTINVVNPPSHLVFISNVVTSNMNIVEGSFDSHESIDTVEKINRES